MSGIPKNYTDQMAQMAEARATGDLLILDNFIDHYYNLSIKTREIMRWHVANVQPQISTIFIWTNMDGLVI